MEEKDEQLMLEFQAGKKEAIEVIYNRYKNSVLNFCLRILKNRADAEDIVGQIFLGLFSYKYQFHPEAKFSTWFFTIAHNSCIDCIRKRKGLISIWFKSEKDGSDFEIPIPDSREISREELENKEKEEIVKSAISKLPINQREAIVLREYNNFSYDEISQVLNCSLEKVKILIFRAREALRVELKSFVTEGN